jgi:hypothetical protein
MRGASAGPPSRGSSVANYPSNANHPAWAGPAAPCRSLQNPWGSCWLISWDEPQPSDP